MIDFLTIEGDQLNQGHQLLQKEFGARGWHVKTPYAGSPHFFISRSGQTSLHIFSTTPPTTSFAAAHLANDKFATHQLLDSAGIKQLKTVMVSSSKTEIASAQALLDEVGAVVVKPIDGGHGKGITVGINNQADLTQAIDYAYDFAKSTRKVIVQECYPHAEFIDIRVACINYSYVASTHRAPAAIIADGQRSLRELINNENTSGKRGEPYRAPLAYINEQMAATYLGDRLDEVPEEGRQVQVLGVANYGAGGEIIDITDDIPMWMRDMAVAAARVVELPVVGVDFMLATLPKNDSTQDELDPVIIEVNKCPSLAIHDLPTRGKARNAVGQYVEYLAGL